MLYAHVYLFKQIIKNNRPIFFISEIRDEQIINAAAHLCIAYTNNKEHVLNKTVFSSLLCTVYIYLLL